MCKTGLPQLRGERINQNGTQGRQVVGLKNHDGAPSRLLVVLFRQPEIDKPNLTTFRQVHGRSSCASPSAELSRPASARTRSSSSLRPTGPPGRTVFRSPATLAKRIWSRSEEHTSELQSP